MRKKPSADSKLELEILRLVRLLPDAHDDQEKYDQITDRMDRLAKIQTTRKSVQVSRDTWALIGANILGIILIMGHEYTHPITTKALNLAIKPIRMKP